jgi:hypothetical protein
MGSVPTQTEPTFAVYSTPSTRGAISSCPLADDGAETRLPMTASTGDVRRPYAPGVDASAALRPSARRATQAKPLRPLPPGPSTTASNTDPVAVSHAPDDCTRRPRHSDAHVPGSVVVDLTFGWHDHTPPSNNAHGFRWHGPCVAERTPEAAHSPRGPFMRHGTHRIDIGCASGLPKVGVVSTSLRASASPELVQPPLPLNGGATAQCRPPWYRPAVRNQMTIALPPAGPLRTHRHWRVE